MSGRDRKPAGDPAGDPAAEPANDDDARLWENVTRSVKPLARKDFAPPPAAPSPGRPPPAARNEPAEKPAGPQSGPRGERERVDISGLRIGAQDRPAQAAGLKSGSGGLGYGDAPGVDRRTATRFRRGLMPIDATLDLHGHTQASGRAALAGFLRAHRAAGRRCVLVVTGKGLKDDWSVGALRQALPGWLNAPDLRRLILSYCQAQPHHGGSGAVYILLRRQRGKGGQESG
ncbi:MAG: Smr/MutS family protein [Rhodospirillaceae bacterium]|nr:Smr/MutS family protein [Rhodospirillaceae bacterium]